MPCVFLVKEMMRTASDEDPLGPFFFHTFKHLEMLSLLSLFVGSACLMNGIGLKVLVCKGKKESRKKGRRFSRKKEQIKEPSNGGGCAMQLDPKGDSEI